jgi:hypothetical protein
MKLIKPSEISARILTLLDESDERVILVSPYMKIAKWYRLRNRFIGLKSRKIPLEIYIRDDPENTATYHDLDQLDLPYTRIPHLHSKLYMNEKYGIVSSMNLLLSSELNSLEIAYITESWEEYVELRDYYLRYIKSGEVIQVNSFTDQSITDTVGLMIHIKEGIKDSAINLWPWFDGNALHISTGRNNYHVLVHEHHLRISAHLKVGSGLKQAGQKELSLITVKINHIAQMKINVQAGTAPGIIEISGQTSIPLKSIHIGGILDEELVRVTDSIIRFILVVEDLIPGESF